MATPTDSRPLGPIWPGRLARLLDCPLQVAFEQGVDYQGDGTALPPALVGTAIHRCIELTFEDPTLKVGQAWSRACDEMSASGPDPRDAASARRSLLRLQRKLPDLTKLIEEHQSTGDPLVEERLQSADGLFRGQPDLVLVGQPTTVVDYKSGTATTEGMVKSGYEKQLLLYAHLVADALSADPVEAWLFSLQEGLVRVDVSPERRQEFIDAARGAIRQFEEVVPGRQPGTPSDTACEWCNHAPDCDEVWTAFADGRVCDLGGGHAIEGTAIGDPMHARNGKSALSLEAERGTMTGHIMVSDLPTAVAQRFNDGQRLRATRLRQQSEEPAVLVWKNHRSRIVPIG